MEALQTRVKMKYLLTFFLLLFFPFALFCESQQGWIVLMVQQGEHKRAWDQYLALKEKNQKHDFHLLQRMCIALIERGYRKNDPESQLLSLYGAHISANEDLTYLFEDGLKHPLAQLQLISLLALSKIQSDQVDGLILKALSSPHLEIRLKAAIMLCEKKHPQAVFQTESLMYKVPTKAWYLFPPLLCSVEDIRSTNLLRRFLNSPHVQTRLSTILSIGKSQRDDLLPQIRQQASQIQHSQQEAAAFALGCLKDESSLPCLKTLANSNFPSVALSAQLALFHLGDHSILAQIEKSASEGKIEAISALGTLETQSKILYQLSQHSDPEVRINAKFSILKQNLLSEDIDFQELLIRDKNDFAFSYKKSPGRTLKSLKVATGATHLFKDDIFAYMDHLEIKEVFLNLIFNRSESQFMKLAQAILNQQQQDCIPFTIKLIERLHTHDALHCLKENQQKFGHPLTRNYCNLALYRLKEPGPWKEQLKLWVAKENQNQLIQLKPIDIAKMNKKNYTLSPEEKGRFLIEVLETLAVNKDEDGIDILVDAIANGHDKNKYAIAGLLLRATE